MPCIRQATEADLEAIVSIYNESIPGRMATADIDPVSVESRRDWFRRRDFGRHPILVADEPGETVGWASLSPFFNGRPAYRDTAEFSLYIASRHQRHGFGAGLYHALEQQAASGGILTIVALVFAHNEPSIRFCQRFGYTRWGLFPRVAVLDGVERDLLVLGKRLHD